MTETATEMSVEDYLALDAASERRHEYLNGVVVAMAGASPRHNVVAHNVGRLLGNALASGRCTVFDAGQRIQIADTGSYVYADLVATCERPAFTDEQPRSLTNPRLAVEGLTRSTRGHD